MKRTYSSTEFIRAKSAQLSWKSLFLVFLAATPAMADWQPVKGGMMTKWGSELKADAVWQEYPRPQMERADWANLNGLWSYAVTAKEESAPVKWDGQILVPFCPESSLSGVGRLIEPAEALWYKRPLPGLKQGKRTLIHFEAVDYTTTIWVNGQRMGSHTGGFTPFSFDITPALKAEGNELLVRVDDATEGFQLHGKQKLKPEGIWYTRVTGIWQTVWVENVAERFINDLDFTTDIKDGSVKVAAKLSGKPLEGENVRVTASFGGKQVATGSGSADVSFKIEAAKLWSPDSPNLYDLKVELLDSKGKAIDEVKSYVALREFGKTKDSNGNWRFTLNGKSIFHWGPLDQGWWPDGLLTPPSDAAMISDIDYLKAAGFNMIRKHIKVEPRRYYAHCDKVGMLMWQDQVSQGYGPETQPKGSNPQWTRMAPNPPEGTWPDEAHDQYVTEYKRMVDHLRDVPCIAVWSPFNEAWGQHRTMEVGKMAADYDKTRPINIASGGNFFPTGDIADEHRYPDPGFPLEDKRFDDYAKVVGEFGGHGMPIEGHLWNKNSPNWGYGGLPKDLAEWKERYAQSIRVLAGLRKQGICAGVYTQTTDVEVEINGLRTYDRVNKVEPAWLKPISDLLLNTPDVVKITVISPTSEKEAQPWKFTTAAPAAGWEVTDFDDTSWSEGKGGFGTRETPNTHIGTEWKTGDIWIRRECRVESLPKGQAVLRLYHDDDTEVFLNGVKIVERKGYVSGYTDIPITQAGLLKVGRNVLAIHCQQKTGGQYIDAGILDETAN
ncbi:MAG: sugar-binding domain-containing protein [Verrucomicrobiota bacterium]